jgi:hypothetical protein
MQYLLLGSFLFGFFGLTVSALSKTELRTGMRMLPAWRAFMKTACSQSQRAMLQIAKKEYFKDASQ